MYDINSTVNRMYMECDTYLHKQTYMECDAQIGSLYKDESNLYLKLSYAYPNYSSTTPQFFL